MGPIFSDTGTDKATPTPLSDGTGLLQVRFCFPERFGKRKDAAPAQTEGEWSD